MKIILSRKGFDSTNGGVASPIFEDGSAVSLPIPAGRRSPTRFDALSAPGTPYHENLGTLVAALTRGKVHEDCRCHLDPDLDVKMGPAVTGWQAAFGQVAAAQQHLDHEQIGKGDLFLFFGWFRQAEQTGERWRYHLEARPVHRLFGWLQVGEIVRVGEDTASARERHPGLGRHPHLWGHWPETNTVYKAAETLDVPGTPARTPGAGLFAPDPKGKLILTAPDAASRSEWHLPATFKPTKKSKGLSYHRDPERWSERDGKTRLRAVARGQEFVLDAATAEGAVEWAADLWKDS